MKQKSIKQYNVPLDKVVESGVIGQRSKIRINNKLVEHVGYFAGSTLYREK